MGGSLTTATDRSVQGAAATPSSPGPDKNPLAHSTRARLHSASTIVMSIVVHVVLAAFGALVQFGVITPGAGALGPPGAEVVLLPASELPPVADETIEVGSPIVTEAADGGIPIPDPLTPGALGEGPDMGLAAGPAGLTDGLGGAGGDLDGEGMGAGGAGGGGSKFFGIEARGTRIAYVVDVSGSMQGNKLAYLKVQLAESISGMLEHMAFFVVAFSNEAYPLGRRDRWTTSDAGGKKWATDQIQLLQSLAGTMPGPAFEEVFSIRPRPDAIYFMTDGQFDPDVADRIAWLNRGDTRIPVHCITFVDKSAEELMRRIASLSGGTYTHVDGRP